MKFLDLTLAEPAANIACDEALLEEVEADFEPAECLRIWESHSHFVVLGHSNRIAAHVNIAACREQRIPILRRISGGGTVVQGPGCLNYALILRNDGRRKIREIYQYVLERHCEILRESCRKAVRFEGISDLTVNGFKVSGNAQYRKSRAVLVHGTFLLQFDLSVIERLLPLPPEQPAYRANRPHNMFVTNLDVDRSSLSLALQRAWNADEALAEVPMARIEQLALERYRRKEWSEKF